MSSRYNWQQEHNAVIITIPCSNPIINKKGSFDLFLSRSYLKFHLQSPKIFMQFDLYSDIDPYNSLNRASVTSQGLQLSLAKASPGQNWELLVCPDKQHAKSRRAFSLQQHEDYLKSAQQTISKQKVQNDKHSIRQQMRIDGERRNLLQQRKAIQKQKAEREVYSSIPSLPNPDIFNQRPEIQIRKPFAQQISFTAKKYPQVPARETHLKEPPMPQSLKPLDGPAHQSHPLWLKDKGDEFYKNGDFNSAINAYNKALEADRDNIGVLLNRSAAFVKLNDFGRALVDLNRAMEFTEDSQILKVSLVRKAACLVWKGMIPEGIQIYEQLVKANPEQESFQLDLQAIQARQQSNLTKSSGDQFFRQGRLQESLQDYKLALEQDSQNEIVLANLAEVYLKLEHFEECLKYCNQSLELITHNDPLKIKVLLRKARALPKNQEALLAVEQALNLEPSLKSAIVLKKTIQSELNLQLAIEVKAEADNALRNGNSQEALVLYKKALMLTSEKSQKSAILTNISACQLMLKQLHDVTRTVDKALSLEPQPSLKLRLHWRRAKAYAELGQLYSAQADLRQAHKFDPENELLKQDLKLIEEKIRG